MQEFSLELHSGITISSVVTETEVSAQPNVNKRDMGNGYVWYTFPETEIEDKK